MQEETCILKVPCVTLRDNTERPETLNVGSNVLAGVNQEKISEGVKLMLKRFDIGAWLCPVKLGLTTAEDEEHSYMQCMDFSKAVRDLGHDPKVTPEEGIKRTVEWMKSIYHSEV